MRRRGLVEGERSSDDRAYDTALQPWTEVALQQLRCLDLLLQRPRAEHGACDARAPPQQVREVDLRKGPSGQPDDQYPPPDRTSLDILGHVGAPDQLEHDVHTGTIRDTLYLGGKRTALWHDPDIEPERPAA